MSASGKVIIVTGAARNMGYHTAAALAKRGAKLSIWGRDQAALDEAAGALAAQGVRRELTVDHVRPGMLLEEDVQTKTGMILVRKGERVTEAVAMRLENFARTVGIQEPVIVLDGV